MSFVTTAEAFSSVAEEQVIRQKYHPLLHELCAILALSDDDTCSVQCLSDVVNRVEIANNNRQLTMSKYEPLCD